MAPLPTPPPLTPAWLRRFERDEARPAALRILRRHLGPIRLFRVLARYLLGLRRDPLAHIPAASDWPEAAEALSRRQFRDMLRLGAALAGVVSPAERAAIVTQVVVSAGERFVAARVLLPTAEAWRETAPADRDAWAAAMVGQFFNMQTEAPPAAEPTRLSFKGTRCRFAELAEAVGRPALAEPFCAADHAHFSRAGCPVSLHRPETLATGGSCCDFRFRWKDKQPLAAAAQR